MAYCAMLYKMLKENDAIKCPTPSSRETNSYHLEGFTALRQNFSVVTPYYFHHNLSISEIPLEMYLLSI